MSPGLGNAIVDVIASVDDRFLLTHSIAKGGMTLIDEFRAQELHKALADNSQALSSARSGGRLRRQHHGGAGLAGRQAAFSSAKCSTTGWARVFGDSHVGAGRRLSPPRRAKAGSPTASCMIAVTPDGQRSMSTYLGACRELTPDDVDENEIAEPRRSSISKAICGTRKTPSRPRARPSRRRRARAAQVALSLSDPFLRRPLPRRIPGSAAPRSEYSFRQ